MKLAKPALHSSDDPIVVIGNGMVGHHFCRAFRLLDATTPIITIGAEATPAYDRVNLTKLVQTPDPESISLAPAAWYAEQHIELRTAERVLSINTEKRTLTTDKQAELTYGSLIIATGSTAWIPPIPGADGERVFPYRTIVDINAIRFAADRSQSAAVIGGGLLGLEAAQALKELDVNVQILETSDYLMPRQLDAEGGIRLKEEISNMGIFVRTQCQTEEIIDVADQKVLRFKDGENLARDFIVVSAGIRPATSFLKGSSITLNPQGAVVINEGLETNVPGIYAIGECASFEGTTFGLVAPGYQMAEVLAKRLTGVKRVFTKPDLSARLKVMGVHVAALGDYFQSDPNSETLTFSEVIPRSGPCYRKLIITKRRVTGIMVVGEWDNLPTVQQAMDQRTKLSWKQLTLFEETGELFKPTSDPAVLRWSDDTRVCNCMMVKKGTLAAAIEEGCDTAEELSARTLAGTVCGGCKPVMSDLLGTPSLPTRVPASALVMITCSILAFFGVGATVLAGPLAYADSVETYWYQVDQLWRDNLLKQISGYSLFILCIAALWLSMQKRFQALKVGNYSAWRAVHTATGLVTIATLFLHTGLDLGANFNSWLMMTFALLNLVGGLTGVFGGLETRVASPVGTMSRRLKPVAAWMHILLFWPIPTLVLFHIASVYYW